MREDTEREGRKRKRKKRKKKEAKGEDEGREGGETVCRGEERKYDWWGY